MQMRINSKLELSTLPIWLCSSPATAKFQQEFNYLNAHLILYWVHPRPHHQFQTHPLEQLHHHTLVLEWFNLLSRWSTSFSTCAFKAVSATFGLVGFVKGDDFLMVIDSLTQGSRLTLVTARYICPTFLIPNSSFLAAPNPPILLFRRPPAYTSK